MNENSSRSHQIIRLVYFLLPAIANVAHYPLQYLCMLLFVTFFLFGYQIVVSISRQSKALPVSIQVLEVQAFSFLLWYEVTALSFSNKLKTPYLVTLIGQLFLKWPQGKLTLVLFRILWILRGASVLL